VLNLFQHHRGKTKSCTQFFIGQVPLAHTTTQPSGFNNQMTIV